MLLADKNAIIDGAGGPIGGAVARAVARFQLFSGVEPSILDTSAPEIV